MGHALVALAIPGCDPVQKVSIIPRGIGALGYTIQRPTEDRFLMGRHELENKMAVLMAGRAAEQLTFGELSTGAADDLAKVTDIARGMVMRYGMDETLGSVSYDTEPANSWASLKARSGSSAVTARLRRTGSTTRCGNWSMPLCSVPSPSCSRTTTSSNKVLRPCSRRKR